MPPTTLHHRRVHNLLLVSKLLSQRDAASPFLLVLDSLEQSAKPLVAEQVKRAKASKLYVVFVAFETLVPPKNIDAFVSAWNQDQQAWQQELTSLLRAVPNRKCFVVFDSLNSLGATIGSNLPALLSAFISPTSSLSAVYHIDVLDTSALTGSGNAYAPATLALLRYLATTVITTHALHHILTKKAARERSHVEPSFGLEEGINGILQGLGANGDDGLVLEMEHKRKSGRGVREWYFMPYKCIDGQNTPSSAASSETIVLLEDHPLYRSTSRPDDGEATGDHAESTFELGLTQKQRQDREGVVLPYFDAQKGGGEGGRILYDMGEDDDFDEEEDEI